MAQARANIPAGSRAWVNGKPYGPGQFLPGGITEYTVEVWTNLDDSQRYPGGPSRIHTFTVVGADDSRADVLAAIAERITQGLLDRVWVDTDPNAQDTSLDGFGEE